MFKNMLKRSWLSIKRKPSRTIILALLLFAMANLVLAAITIKSAVSASMDYAKKSLGGTVTLQADMEKLRSSEQPQTGQQGTADFRSAIKNMVRPSVKKSVADKISSYSDFVRDYSYSINSVATADDSLELPEETASGPQMGFGGGREQSGETTIDSNLTIQGINAYAYISGVQNETLSLKSGNYFDESSEDKILISYELATLNNLSVGDKITIQNSYTESKISLEIIGIYDTSEENSSANLIYANTDTAAKFLNSSSYNDGDYSVQNVKYYMINSELADSFVSKINSDFPTLSDDNLKISVDTSEYDKMVSSISQVGSFATTILVIVVIASIAIITLIITINVKDRRYEMGVLLSLGATKKNVFGQILTELVIVGSVAFLLASFTSTFFAKSLGSGLLESQIASSKQESANNFGRPGSSVGNTNRPNNTGQNSAPNFQNPDSQVSAISELDINPTATDFALLFILGYAVIILSLLVPSFSILRYQPKTILSGKE